MTKTDWRELRLGNLVVEARPGFASGHDLEEGMFQFRMNNLSREGQIDLSKRRRVPGDTKSIDTFLLRPGDVLFNATNSPELVGKSAYIADLDEPAVFSNHFLRLRVNTDLLEPRFLWRWLQLQWHRGLFRSRARQWVNQATYGREALLELPIRVPPIGEQRRIAAVLDQADKLRAKRQTFLALVRSLSKSIFLDMFGDPVSNQRGWDLVDLGELGTLDRGVSRHRPRNDPQLLGGSYPLIQTGDVTRSGGYITRFTTTYSDLGLKQSRMWPAGTLCITIAANIARTGILDFDACFPDSVVGFTPFERATVEYIREVLSFHQKRLEDAAPEFAQKNINLRILRELRLPCPPIQLQTRFSELVGRERALGHALSDSELASDDLFRSLQRRAFAGRL